MAYERVTRHIGKLGGNPEGAFAYDCTDETQQFVDDFYASEELIDHDYLGTLRKRGVRDAEFCDIEHADLELVRALLTAGIRQDRFCEGLIADLANSGYFDRCLRRLAELAGEGGEHPEFEYPALGAHPLMTGSEPVAGDSMLRGGCMLGYWQWAHSDLNSNTERGKFAEYLVRLSLGLDREPEDPWAPYDILWHAESAGDVRIEVKSSAYVQAWAQRKPSAPSFTICETRAWRPETGEYEEQARRQSDVYVFCMETYRGHGEPDPTDIGQWDFYAVATSRLDARGRQKTITLAQIEGELGACACNLWELPDEILRACDRGGKRRG